MDQAGVFAQLARIARESSDRIVGLLLDHLAVDGCITKAPGGGEVAGPSPVDRRKRGMTRSVLVEGYGIPLGRVLAGAQRHDSPTRSPCTSTPATTRARPARLRPSAAVRVDRAQGREGAPIQASRRWHVERTNAWHNAFNRLQRCYERREKVIDAFFDLADAIITVRSLIRRAWLTHRWDTRPARRR